MDSFQRGSDKSRVWIYTELHIEYTDHITYRIYRHIEYTDHITGSPWPFI